MLSQNRINRIKSKMSFDSISISFTFLISKINNMYNSH